MVFGYIEESSCSSNEENKIYEKSTSSSDGPMNSAWPTYSHDNCHTLRLVSELRGFVPFYKNTSFY